MKIHRIERDIWRRENKKKKIKIQGDKYFKDEN